VSSTLGSARAESIESLMRNAGAGDLIATWGCDVDPASAPHWLQLRRRCIGLAACTRQSVASSTYRTFSLLHDFDAIVYLPRVTAEEIPLDRPRVPPRKRNE